MLFSKKTKNSPRKRQATRLFRDHVSSAKVAFFEKYGMDFVMGRREGPYLWDLDGQKKLFNLHCNGGVFNLGHKNQGLINLFKENLDLYDIGNHHLLSEARSQLAATLAQLMPGNLNYTVFGVGGGEAIDLAFKVARSYTGKAGIISVIGGYHGHTGLALAAGDEKYRKPFGPSAPGFKQVPFGDFEKLRQAIDEDTAAIILETIPATLGIVIPEREYLQKIRDLCDQKQILFILDEVQTGLGRTGKLWAFEHFDLIPDMVVLGKGLSGGLYPISATVLRRDLESVFHPDPFIHISTFGGSELGCVLAKRVLEISADPEFLDHVNRLADGFKENIGKLLHKYPKFLTGFRQLGLMMGLKLRDELSGPILTKTAYDHDLLLVYANNDTSVCQLLPPLIMKMEEIEPVIHQLDVALKDAERLRPVLKIKRKLEKMLKPFSQS